MDRAQPLAITERLRETKGIRAELHLRNISYRFRMWRSC